MFPPRNLSNARTSGIFYLGVDTSLLPVVPDDYESVTIELLVTSLDDNMDVCLMPDTLARLTGDFMNFDTIAALSSLEVRSIPEILYPVFDHGKFTDSGRTVNPTISYYVTLSRLNFGGNESSPAIRYPFDKYDRLWYAAPRDSWLWETGNMETYQWLHVDPSVIVDSEARTMVGVKTDPRSEFEVKSMNSSTVSSGSSANDSFQVPPAVFASAWEGVNLNSTISFSLNIGSSWISHRLVPFYYSVSVVLFDVNSDMNRSRSVDVSNRDEDVASQWIFQDADVPRTRPYIWSEGRFGIYSPDNVTFEIVPAANSTLPAMINALELYGVVENVKRKTSPDDVSKVRTLLDNLPDSDQIESFGDPCLPLPWNWIICQQDRIRTVNLTSRGLQGNLKEDFKLPGGLLVLDLSNNSFHGTLPSTFSDSHSNRLSVLRLANNSFTGMIPDAVWSSKPYFQQIVDLSNNRFTELNLTTWTLNNFTGPQRVNFVNNTIRNVIFGDTDVESIRDEDMLLFLSRPQGYILLGENNEWCSSSEISRARVLKAYLCRDSELDVRYLILPGKDANRTLIIALGVSGSVFLVIACVLLGFLWQIWRRMKNLHHIQEELAKEDVRPPFYKYEELRAATKHFSKENELGKGGFGAVYKAELADKSIVAVKLLFPMEQNLTDFLKEAVLITGIKHRNLVQLKGCCVRDKKRMLVYEFAENGNLAQALWGNDKSFFLNWTQRLKICIGVAKGLAYLHEELQPNIIHRDIKPYNILLDKDWNAKIADFGLARHVREDAGVFATRIGGTLGYLAPEYIQGLITEKLDVYSYGILLLEIISGRKCIDQSAPADEYYLRSWAFNLYKNKSLLKMVEEPLLESATGAEIEIVLKIALSCSQEKYENRPSMSEVVVMLTSNTSSVALDIIEELQDQQYALYGSLFESSTLSKVNENEEREEEVLLESSSLSRSMSRLDSAR
ncbi:hypothetical protein R1sor_021351 [Riccia sorocarpa]